MKRLTLALLVASIAAAVAAIGAGLSARHEALALAGCQIHSNTSEELAFVALLQSYRDQHIPGSFQLSVSAPLNAAAAGYAQYLIDHPGASGHYADGGTYGRAWADRAIQCGYPSSTAAGGEGLAVVQGSGPVSVSPQEALNIMAAEPGGGANVPSSVGPQVRCVGVAKLTAPNGHEVAWVALLFGIWSGSCPQSVTGGAPPPSTSTASTTTPSPTPSPTPTQRADGASVEILAGWNLVVIPAGKIDEVLYRAKGCFRSVYQQDGNRWLRYSPDAPAYASNLRTSNGGVFWVEGTAANCGRVPL